MTRTVRAYFIGTTGTFGFQNGKQYPLYLTINGPSITIENTPSGEKWELYTFTELIDNFDYIENYQW